MSISDSANQKLVAELVARNVISKAENCDELVVALEREYPFRDDDPKGREIWLDALLRHAHDHIRHERQKM
jgi:hypothetical protein